MKIINDLNELKNNKEIISNLYNKYGETFQQSYESIFIEMSTKPEKQISVIVDKNKEVLLAFEKKDNEIWSSIINSFPILNNGLLSFEEFKILLDEIIKVLNAKTLYFQNVYQIDNMLNYFKNLEEVNLWQRLDNPLIDCTCSHENVMEKSFMRAGSVLKRQQKAFEKEMYVEKVDKKIASEILKVIEYNSWKRKCNQDMISRNQFDYYSNLLDMGIAELIVAFNSFNIPIAYRLDSIVKDKVYFIKTSYDDKYKKYSPGSYLSTFDITKRYCDKGYKYIDLYGSPNILKDMIETKRIGRFDICYPYDNCIDIIKKDRKDYDSKYWANYLEKKSIKKLYI